MSKFQEVAMLIASMSKNEKGDFTKLHLKEESEKDEKVIFLSLFDAINQLESKSETKFSNRHPDLADKKKLPSRLNELAGKLEEFLIGKRSNKVNQELYTLVETAKLYLSIEQIKPGMRNLAKAEQMARENEHLEDLLEILRIKRGVLFKSEHAKIEEIQEVIGAIGEVGKMVDLKFEMLWVKDWLFLFDKMKPKGELEEVQKIKMHEFEKNWLKFKIPQNAVFDTRLSFFFASALFFQLSGNKSVAFEYHRRIHQLWMSSPLQRRQRANDFVNAYSNYLNYCLIYGSKEQFEEDLLHLQELPEQNIHQRHAILQNGLFLRLRYHFVHCEWTEVQKMEEDYEKLLCFPNIELPPSRRMAFELHFAWGNMVMLRYRECQHWIQSILGRKSSKERRDILEFSLLLQPIASYQSSGTEGAFDSHLKALERKAKDMKTSFAKQVVQLLSSIQKAKTSNAIITLAKESHRQIGLNVQKQTFGGGYEITLILYWLESIFRQMPLRDIHEEKYIQASTDRNDH